MCGGSVRRERAVGLVSQSRRRLRQLGRDHALDDHLVVALFMHRRIHDLHSRQGLFGFRRRAIGDGTGDLGVLGVPGQAQQARGEDHPGSAASRNAMNHRVQRKRRGRLVKPLGGEFLTVPTHSPKLAFSANR